MTTDGTPAADPLYDLPPGDFVAARNALAKELRTAGDKDQAAVVAKLRRPSAIAHGLNHVARHRPAALEAALAAGAALQAASDAAVAGEAGGLAKATANDRDAMRALADQVAEIAGAKAADIAQKLTATIRAAVAQPDVADEVRAGRLDAEREPADFGFGLGTTRSEPAAPRDDLAPRREARQAKVDKATREQAEREAEERRARQREEAKHRQRVAQLEARAERLADKATAAEAAAAEARAAATAAADELERARREGPT